MNFLYRSNLLLLLAVIPLAGFMWLALRRRKRLLALLSTIDRENGAWRMLAPLLVFVCVALSIARPYSGTKEIKIGDSGRDIMAIVDVSKSMLTADVAPNRLQFTKRKLYDLLGILQHETSGDRLGIILFAGDSYLFCPITSDYSVLKMFIDAVSTDLITTPGTALDRAIDETARTLAEVRASSPLLILLSDGEDNSVQIEQVLATLNQDKLHLNAIGIGTAEGRPIEERPGYFIKDASGNTVISRLNEASLRRLAEGSGGIYVAASLDDSDLSTILARRSLADLYPGEATPGEHSVKIYNEFGPLLIWIPLLIFAAAAVLSKQSMLFSLILLLSVCRGNASAQEFTGNPDEDNSANLIVGPKQTPAPQKPGDGPARPTVSAADAESLHSAYRAYQLGDYERALKSFQYYHDAHPDDSDVAQALGSTLYRLGQNEKAADAYSDSIKSATNGRQHFRGLYNLGNSYFKSQKYQSAVDAYEQALKIKPGDGNATSNLQLARQMLQLQKQQDQKNQDKNQQKQNNQSQGGSGKEKSSGGQSQQNDKNKSQELDKGKGDKSDNKNNQKQDQQDQGKEKDQQNSTQGGAGQGKPDQQKNGKDQQQGEKSEQQDKEKENKGQNGQPSGDQKNDQDKSQGENKQPDQQKAADNQKEKQQNQDKNRADQNNKENGKDSAKNSGENGSKEGSCGVRQNPEKATAPQNPPQNQPANQEGQQQNKENGQKQDKGSQGNGQQQNSAPSSQPQGEGQENSSGSNGKSDSESGAPLQRNPAGLQKHEGTALKESEARAWLESMQDSLAMLPRKTGRGRGQTSGGQTW